MRRLLSQTTLRNILGTKNLHEILSDRESISGSMQVSDYTEITQRLNRDYKEITQKIHRDYTIDYTSDYTEVTKEIEHEIA